MAVATTSSLGEATSRNETPPEPPPPTTTLVAESAGTGVSAVVARSNPTAIALPGATLLIPDGALPAAATVVATPVSVDGIESIAGFTAAGSGIAVDLGGAALSSPATVSFDVATPPTGAEPVSLHVADDGSWEFEPATYADGRLTLSTTSFSIQLPGFLNPVEHLVSSVFGWSTRLVGLRTSPPDCHDARAWVGFVGGNSVITHQCVSSNSQGEPELVIRSNRSYWIQVNVPQPNRYVWVDSMPGVLQSLMFGGDTTRYLLPPGATMTIGLVQPSSNSEFRVELDHNNLTVLWTALELLIGDTRVAEYYTMVRCVNDDWSISIESFRPTVERLFNCLVDVVGELADPGKAARAAEELLGPNAAVDLNSAPQLDALAGRFKGLGKVFSLFSAALGAVTAVDQVAGEIVEGAEGQWISVAMSAQQPQAGAGGAATAAAPSASATTAPGSASVALNASDRVLRQGDGTAWYVDAQHVRHHIPDGGTYLCLTVWRGKGVIDDATNEQVASLTEGDAASCRVDEAADHVLRQSDGTAWFVDGDLVRHHVPDGGTYECLIAAGKPLIDDVTAEHVDALSVGDDATCTQPVQPPSVPDQIIRIPDGTAWYVDASNVRHHIPDGGTYLCMTAWRGKRVSDVSPEQAAALQEADAASCRVDEAANRVLRQSDGTSWFVDGGLVRHHIPNGGTYNCLVAVHGTPLIDALTTSHIDALPSGDNATCSALLVGPDGTSFLLDSTDNRYWVPDGGIFQCLEQRGTRVFRYDAWDTINLFVDDPNQHASCS
jgi:hypothetical protein